MRPVRSTLVVAALLASALTLGSAGPATARPTAAIEPEPNAFPIVLSGNFVGDSYDDLFFFSPGPEPDILYDFKGAMHDGAVPEVHLYDIQGAYQPFVGDFTGSDSRDDIFWYRPGTASDMIWNFTLGDGIGAPEYTVVPVQVSGTYRPVVGKFVGGARSAYTDDIFWYGPGAIADSLWAFDQVCQSCAPRHVNRSVPSVRGATYRPVAGNFIDPALEDIYWYAPDGTESIWDFRSDYPGAMRIVNSPALQVAGKTYQVAVVDSFEDQWDDLVFAGPGTTPDALWDFYGGSVYKGATPEAITGTPAAVLGVEIGALPEADDLFVYYPDQTRGRYYDFFEESNQHFWQRFTFDPVPLTELPPQVDPVAAAGATAAAPEGRRWPMSLGAGG
jgi:hypothetical protein